jgi:hypothetical protein
MKRINSGLLWAAFFVLVGIYLLIWNLGILGPLATAIWGGLFIAAGVGFLIYFFTDRTHRWEAVAGTTLIGSGAVVLLQWQNVALGDWKLGLVLLSVALGFWLVAIFRPADWWAVLPAGVLTLQGLMVGLARQLSPQAFDALFLAGLGAVFGLIYLLRLKKGDARWALIPAVGLALTGAVSWFNVTEASPDLLRLWPIALIALGIAVGFITYSRRSKPAPAAKEPAQAQDASVMAPGAARVEKLPDLPADPAKVDIYDVIKNQPPEQ